MISSVSPVPAQLSAVRMLRYLRDTDCEAGAGLVCRIQWCNRIFTLLTWISSYKDARHDHFVSLIFRYLQFYCLSIRIMTTLQEKDQQLQRTLPKWLLHVGTIETGSWVPGDWRLETMSHTHHSWWPPHAPHRNCRAPTLYCSDYTLQIITFWLFITLLNLCNHVSLDKLLRQDAGALTWWRWVSVTGRDM